MILFQFKRFNFSFNIIIFLYCCCFVGDEQLLDKNLCVSSRILKAVSLLLFLSCAMLFKEFRARIEALGDDKHESLSNDKGEVGLRSDKSSLKSLNLSSILGDTKYK